jgi:dTDP-4-dehydrorhamnose reductase
MERTLILGGYGRLGRTLQAYISQSEHEIFLQGRQEVAHLCFDPTDTSKLHAVLAQLKPDNIINLVAITNLKICEQNPKLAFIVNTQIANTIQQFLSHRDNNASNTFFLQISTDQMYCSSFPNAEDQTMPSNVYCMTKMLGEHAALMCGGTVFRTNYIGASADPSKPSLTDWMVKSLKNKSVISSFNNIYINALHSSTLCKLINRALSRKRAGLFNVGTSSCYSKSDIIRHLGQCLHLDTSYVKFEPATFSDNVERPLNMSMDVSKFEEEYEIKLPKHNFELDKVSKDYKLKRMT